MPGNLSKFVKSSCKDYSHKWVDSCISAAMGLGLDCLEESLKIYSTVYIASLLINRRKITKDVIIRTILGILQSSAFLSMTAFNFSANICALNRILGGMHVLTVSFLPSFLSNLVAIIIEKPARRTLLCLYVSNIATETLYNMGVWRGYFPRIPYGSAYIFAASISVLLYLHRAKRMDQDTVYKIIRFVIGPYEQFQNSNKKSEHLESTTCTESLNSNRECKRHTYNIIFKSFQIYKEIINNLKNKYKHWSCPHPHSCAHYILMSGTKLFSYGYGIQVAIQLILQSQQIFKRPKHIKNILFKKQYLNIATFLGAFSALYKLTSCLLRRTYNKDSPKFAIPAGLIASIAFIAFPNNTLALYFMWKGLHIIWNEGVEKGIFPEFKWFVILLYSFSTAILFHAAILEPQNLRSSYWKFLYRVSGGRIAVISRSPLEIFGMNSSKYLKEVLIRTNTSNQRTFTF
ncbi:PREDICTED: transmembrane protein 135-like [Polistes dominula]|uniref:Transmembrane protein 135-like n=1 Tax=Polistes dominula TaxID=743375 RepID=A0ABM1J815_POLDO|nr:PREDICTED: transmembrane protein 135-like [Polistes dominula]XP_015188604.1 PREDICTED: transmembrane protein 135-like [Polistes dominula]